MGVWYATRNDVIAGPGVKLSTGLVKAVDRALDSVSRRIERYPMRVFYPQFNATRYFSWPPERPSDPWRLYTADVDVIDVSTLTVAGTVIPATDYQLEPVNEGPPFTTVEIIRGSTTGSFSTGTTPQRAIQIDGTFGYSEETESAGTLAAAIADTTSTSVTLSDPSAVDVGHLLVVGTEWMQVTGRAFADSTVTTSGSLTAKNSSDTLTVSDGSGFVAGEVIKIGTELMTVEDVDGNDLVLDRAVRGSTIAAHTSATAVYRENVYTVKRGQLGSVAATALDGAAVSTWVVPEGVRSLAIAEAMVEIAQQSAAYGRVIGSGDNAKEARGAGLNDLRRRVQNVYGHSRKVGRV